MCVGMESPFFAYPESFVNSETITGISVADYDGCYYQLSVSSDSLEWTVQKRFSDFVAFHKRLQDGGVNPPPLPSKLSKSGRTEKLRAYIERVVRQQDRMPEEAKDLLKNFLEFERDITKRMHENSAKLQTMFADTQAQQEKEIMELREQLRIKTELLAEAEQRMSNQLDGWMSDQVEVLTAKLAAANTENTAIRNENAQLREQLQALGAHAPEESHQPEHDLAGVGRNGNGIGTGRSKKDRAARRSMSWMRRKKRPSKQKDGIEDDATALAQRLAAELATEAKGEEV